MESSLYYLSYSLILLCIVLQFSFLLLEMFFWDSHFALQVHGLSPEAAKSSASLAKNQGLYNGFLGMGLIWALCDTSSLAIHIKIFFLMCMIVGGGFGGFTVSWKIAKAQALPALLCLCVTLLVYY